MCCASAVLLDTWSKHEWNGGLQLETVSELELLSIQTCNSTYEIAVVSSQTGDVLVRGGRYFPDFSPARLTGSSMGGSFLKLRGIYVGFNVELQVGARSIITSPVQSISRVPAVDC